MAYLMQFIFRMQ